jgi:hypothetical protein
MKGKHAASASARQIAESAAQSEAAYRRQVVRLTEERDQARAERDAARIAWKKEVRLLSARLNEGLSPRVEALQHELERIRADRDQLKARFLANERLISEAVARIAAHFYREHQLSSGDALDLASQILTIRLVEVEDGRVEELPFGPLALGPSDHKLIRLAGTAALDALNRVTNKNATPRHSQQRTAAGALDAARASVELPGEGQ